MRVRMVLAGFFGVMGCMSRMTMRYVSVVAGFLMVTRFVMFGGGPVVRGGVLMMICGFAMMICGFL